MRQGIIQQIKQPLWKDYSNKKKSPASENPNLRVTMQTKDSDGGTLHDNIAGYKSRGTPEGDKPKTIQQQAIKVEET